MSVRHWLDDLKQRMSLAPNRRQRRAPQVRKSAGRPLRLESLEDRWLFSLTPFSSVPLGPISTTADINNDENPDLVAVGGIIVTAPGNGDGTFGRAQITDSLPPTAQSVAVGDFNADGNIDLAAGHYEYYGTGDHDVSILFGNGDGTFDAAIPLDISAFGASWGVASGDVDADGIADLVAVESDVPGGFGWPYVHILRGQRDGSLALASTYGLAGNGPGPRVDVYTPVLADFNGDGNADVAVPAGTAGKGFVKVFLGNGEGTLQSPRDITTHSTTYWGTTRSVTVGDLNGDGRLDMATLNDNQTQSILLGNGDGTFQPAQHIVAGEPWNGALAAVDLSGDGALDLVMNSGGIVSVQLGYGDGSFALPMTIATGSSFALDDFNNDTRPDAAVSNFGSTSVLLNDGVWPVLPTAPPNIRISDAIVTEGNTGTVAAMFTVALSAASTQPVTVAYATNSGTATASDYTAASGTLTFAPGQTTKTIAIQVKGDRVAESNETFAVNLTNPTNATIADGQGVGTIVDNEPRISISDVTKSEGMKGKTTLFTFTVTLSSAYDQSVTMSYRTVNGSAKTSNSDYVAKTGTLTFAPGETTKTITIEVKGDSSREGHEMFYVDLFASSSNSIFAKSRGIGTILNDD